MYQARRVPFANKENYAEKRRSRAEEKAKSRRYSRQTNFCTNRNIAADLMVTSGIKEECAELKTLSRSEMLKKWKQEKEVLKKAERDTKAKEKPPFKCGRVHHKPPPVLGPECRRSARIKNNQNTLSGMNFSVAKSENLTGKKKEKQSIPGKKSFQSFAPVSHRFKAPDNLPKIEENSVSLVEDITVWKADYSMVFPAQLSPWVSKGRGSDGGKKDSSLHPTDKCETPISTKKTQPPIKSAELSKDTPDDLRIVLGKRLFEKSLKTPEVQEKISPKLAKSLKTAEVLEETVKKMSPQPAIPILSKEDAASLQNFRSLYDGEMNRLDGLCSHWDSVLSSEACHEIPIDLQDSIRTTVCQTRLLMREKLAQFKDLLQQFQVKTSKKSPIITSSDLQGFWDLVSIQVNDVDAKFSSLDALKWNNWIKTEDPNKNTTTGVFRRRNVTSTNFKAKKPAAGKSSFKAYIAEQRRKMEEAKDKVLLKGNGDSAKKSQGCINTSQINLSSTCTPTPILKRRSSVRLSARKQNGQGHSVTPARSSRRVTFAADSICNDRPSVVVVKSPYITASVEDDLISWESPSKDFLRVGARKSPRLSGNKNDSFL